NWENRRQGAVYGHVNGFEPDYQCAAYGGGTFVAQGWALAASTNGVNWATTGPAFPWLNTMAYGNGIFVGVGDGHDGGAGGRVYAVGTSPDGFNWTIAPSPTGAGLTGVAFANAQFIAVGWNSSPSNWVVSASTDGVNWTNRLTGNIVLSSITYGAG